MRSSRARQRVGAVLAGAALVAGLSIGAVAWANSGASGSATTTPAAKAKALANEVIHAKTHRARSKALRDVMHAVNIGIYKPNGARILRGDESGPQDFYLYNFDVKILGDALAQGKETSVNDLAQGLSSLLDKGRTVSGSTIRSILVDGVKSAEQNPSSRKSLVPLLVRDLGRHHGYDLGQTVSLTKPSLDALQRFLINADIGLTLLREVRQQSPAPASSAQPNSGNPCDSDFAGTAGDWAKLAKWGISFTEFYSKKISPAVKKAGPIIDLLQGSILAFSVDIQGLGKYRVHADTGYPGHPPGEFKVGLKAVMRDNLGNVLVKCGKLAGMAVPPKGPIDDMKVTWLRPEDDGYGSDLDQWGTVTCPKSGCKKTDGQGESWIHFKAMSYSAVYDPGLLVIGHFDGIANYLTSFGNVIGVVDEYLIPKDYTPHWSVLTHPCSPPAGAARRC